MLELLNVYRVQFKKREPIFIGASCYTDALTRLSNDRDFCVDEGDEITSIAIVSPQIFV